MPPALPEFKVHLRRPDTRAAVVFIHGFSGHPEKTWGAFPKLLGESPGLAGWDVFSLGYDTRLEPDVRGVWAADPAIPVLGTFLKTRTTQDPLERYQALAIVAHSMGGLVAQRALLDHRELLDRVSHLFLFGTPSAGVGKAGRFSFLKRQIEDMDPRRPFIQTLRKDWNERFGNGRPFRFWAVAGARDDFVPWTSSLGPFSKDDHVVVFGDHRRIVRPDGPDDMSLKAVVKGLRGEAAVGGPWNSALLAIEQREFRRAVQLLEPHAGELDEDHLVGLALALDSLGERGKAVAVLREHSRLGTDAVGVLAGRLKRRWKAEGREADGREALLLYRSGYKRARQAGKHDQAYYHGINLAFMELAFADREATARELATQVLEHCGRTRRTHWSEATRGDAHLHRGDVEAALAAYQDALDLGPTPRQVESMYEQAYMLAGLIGDEGTSARVDALFRPKENG